LQYCITNSESMFNDAHFRQKQIHIFTTILKKIQLHNKNDTDIKTLETYVNTILSLFETGDASMFTLGARSILDEMQTSTTTLQSNLDPEVFAFYNHLYNELSKVKELIDTLSITNVDAFIRAHYNSFLQHKSFISKRNRLFQGN